MKAIYLTGFMGSGKTSVASALAKELSMPFIDTDEKIVSEIGKEIPDIFEEEGEEAFRSYETAILEKLPEEDVIISTGGGIILKEVNRNLMKQNGMVVYLHCEAEEIVKRLEGDSSRPLLEVKDRSERVAKIFSERLSRYKDAHVEIDTTHRTIEEIVKEIVALIG
ncbi:shikimate kinase [Guptibacillus algicola]|uniref:shikimate kinase n=1 Tax=Guptibacillus algicola TaxID=225844 RepID=UPI001CD7705E|nr:shikimate kinase [Alkalihalobacillus algicola]MCA0986003.1 shikimate kinase [Alkalihalobacillus algicola]